MTQEHRIELCIEKVLVTVKLNGETVMYRIMRGEMRLRKTWFGRIPNCAGEIWWWDFTYYGRNPTEPDHLWNWQVRLGQYPDQYQLDHTREVHNNQPLPTHGADNGYSSWCELPDGHISSWSTTPTAVTPRGWPTSTESTSRRKTSTKQKGSLGVSIFTVSFT